MYAVENNLTPLEATEKELRYYVTPEGAKPYRKWRTSLTRDTGRLVDLRLRRVLRGNFGDVKPEGEGVSELRFHEGKGLRIYFGQDGKKLIILLAGGDKSTQEKDIQRAKEYWKDYKQRSRKGHRPQTEKWTDSAE